MSTRDEVERKLRDLSDDDVGLRSNDSTAAIDSDAAAKISADAARGSRMYWIALAVLIVSIVAVLVAMARGQSATP